MGGERTGEGGQPTLAVSSAALASGANVNGRLGNERDDGSEVRLARFFMGRRGLLVAAVSLPTLRPPSPRIRVITPLLLEESPVGLHAYCGR